MTRISRIGWRPALVVVSLAATLAASAVHAEPWHGGGRGRSDFHGRGGYGGHGGHGGGGGLAAGLVVGALLGAVAGVAVSNANQPPPADVYSAPPPPPPPGAYYYPSNTYGN